MRGNHREVSELTKTVTLPGAGGLWTEGALCEQTEVSMGEREEVVMWES